MVDPMDALAKLQEAVEGGWVELRPGEIYTDLGVWLDKPEGKTRLTYAKVTGRRVDAIALFCLNGKIQGVPCFQTGYAVVESEREKGFASDLVSKGIQEMRIGFGKRGAKAFYVEAVVGLTNIASNKLASRILSSAPETITDEFSGEPALRYVKLFQCEI